MFYLSARFKYEITSVNLLSPDVASIHHKERVSRNKNATCFTL